MKKKNRYALEEALDEYRKASRVTYKALQAEMYPEEYAYDVSYSAAASDEAIKADYLALLIERVLEDER